MELITKQANASKPQRIAEGDLRKERQAIYNTRRWTKLRKEILMRNPICELCNKELSEHVHHIVSFMDYTGMERINAAYSSNNLQALCSSCHSKLHQKHE
jgi:5-methylcytosine-specific restriction protein A